MKKLLHGIFVVLVFGVFLASSYKVLEYFTGYRLSGSSRQEAVAEYTQKSSGSQQNGGSDAALPTGGKQNGDLENKSGTDSYCAPIKVDFKRLRQASADVVGWIYCEGTVINFPVVYGRDNEYYLERDFRGAADKNGAIFTDMRNKDGFTDNNVIIYGHHMQDGSMFASLRNWFDASYYAEHPVMWLLTPEQDYRVDLFAGYPTTADSDTYTVFHEGGEHLEAYLNWAKKWSVIQTDVETEPDGHYVVLSTCAYYTDDARTALHGKLVPIDSAGGIPLK